MPYIIVRENNIPKCVSINTAIELNINKRYIMNDLCSVYTHWDSNLCRNALTENILKGDVTNGKGSE